MAKKKKLTTEEKKALLIASGEQALAEGLELRPQALGSRKEGYCCVIGSLSLDRGQEDSGYQIADDVLGFQFRRGVVEAFDWRKELSPDRSAPNAEAMAEFSAGHRVGMELLAHFKGKILPPKLSVAKP